MRSWTLRTYRLMLATRLLLNVLQRFDTRADSWCSNHSDFEISERVRVVFDDQANNFNGKSIKPDAVLWGMVRAMQDYITANL
jgi:hypothetical protein